MKKIILSSFITMMMLLSLVGCQSDAKDESSSSSPETSSRKTFNTKPTIQPTVIIDQAGVKITANQLTYQDNQVQLNISIKNDSGKNLSVTSSTTGSSVNAINGYMMSGGYVYAQVPNGTQKEEDVEYSFNELAVYGIYEIADITVGFQIDDDDTSDDYLEVPAKGIKTDLKDYDYKKDTFKEAIQDQSLQSELGYSIDLFNDKKLFKGQGLKVLSQGIMTNKDKDQSYFIEVENTTDQYMKVLLANASINGLNIHKDIFYFAEVLAHSKAIIIFDLEKMGCQEKEAKALGIDNLGELKLSLSAEDKNGNTLLKEGKVTITQKKSQYDDSGKTVYNKNHIKIIAKTPIKVKSDIYIPMIIINDTKSAINYNGSYDKKLQINDKESDLLFYNGDINAKEAQSTMIHMYSFQLKKVEITKVQDIKSIQLTIELSKDNEYDPFATPSLTIKY